MMVRTLSLLAMTALLSLTSYDAHAQSNTTVMPSNPELTRPVSFANLAQKLLPTVVNISSTGRLAVNQNPYGTPEQLAPDTPASPFEDFFQDYLDHQNGSPNVENASLGSGFIVDAAKGLIVTNNHVITEASDIRVTLSDDSSYRAEIVGIDEKTDIALLKINTLGKQLTQINYGDSDNLRVGDWILAIGNPFGLGGTVTAGIVSARSRDINAGPYDDFIQTDASINRGNSGGPMFNTKGELIGINTAIFSPSGGSIGIGFAIPINMSRSIINQLIEFGEVKRGWLGIKVQSITPEIAEAIGLKDGPKGALVADVIDNSPAQKSGLQPYDVLLEFNGRAIKTMRDLPIIVAESKIDTPLDVKILREGAEMDTQVTLEAAKIPVVIKVPPVAMDGDDEQELMHDDTHVEPHQLPEQHNVATGHYIKQMQMALSTISRPLSQKYNLIENMNGIVVTHVDDFSNAAEKGMQPGDVITEIDREKVISIDQVDAALVLANTKRRTSLLLLVDRGGEEVFVALKLNNGASLKRE